MKRAGQLSPWATHRNYLGIFNTLTPESNSKDSYLKDLEYAQALGIFKSSQVVPTQPVTHNSSFPLDLEQPHRVGPPEKPTQAVTAKQWVLLGLMRVQYSDGCKLSRAIPLFLMRDGGGSQTQGAGEGYKWTMSKTPLCQTPGINPGHS